MEWPNDLKLSDGGGWRGGCTVGERRRPEAAAVRSVGNMSAASDGIFSEGFQTLAENQACPGGGKNAWRPPSTGTH